MTKRNTYWLPLTKKQVETIRQILVDNGSVEGTPGLLLGQPLTEANPLTGDAPGAMWLRFYNATEAEAMAAAIRKTLADLDATP